MSDHTNITRIKAVVNSLKELNEHIVFVGGATVSFYSTKASAEVRPTDDVDVIIELVSYGSYASLDERLRSVGFVNDVESGIICRYIINGITVDIMPTTPEIIGFSNKWYPEGFENAISKDLDGIIINIFSPPYFLASKLEAFKGRGGDDYRTSTDFEDIVYVLENNNNVIEEVSASEESVKAYLTTAFSALLNDPSFEEGIYAHLDPPTAQQQQSRIVAMLHQIVNS